jgi:hypothetical protein
MDTKADEGLARLRRRMAATFTFWSIVWIFALCFLGTRLEELGGRFPDQPLSFVSLIHLGVAVPIICLRHNEVRQEARYWEARRKEHDRARDAA